MRAEFYFAAAAGAPPLAKKGVFLWAFCRCPFYDGESLLVAAAYLKRPQLCFYDHLLLDLL